MKRFQDAMAGTFIVATLVAAGFWFARDPDGQSWPLSYLNGSANGNDLGVPRATISRIDWSADGRKILALFRGAENANLFLALLDTQGTSQIPIEIPGDLCSTASLAPDAKHVVAGAHDGSLWWIKLDSSEPPTPLVELHFPTWFTATAITNDSLLVAGGTNVGSIYLCDTIQSTQITVKTCRRSPIRTLHFSGDHKWLVAAHADGLGTVWDVTTGERLQEFTGHQGPMTVADFLPDGKRVITASDDGTVRIWEIANGWETQRVEFGPSGVSTLAVSPDGRTAAWAGFEHKIIVWDLERGCKRFQIATSVPIIYHLTFSPDGTNLAVAGREATLRFYDVQTAAETMRIEVATPDWL
jgi:WD40 repeat protein